MFVVTVLAAHWITRRSVSISGRAQWLAVGLFALVLMLAAEFGLVLWLRGMSIREYLASRDPVSGTVYYLMLGVFAVMPMLMANCRRR